MEPINILILPGTTLIAKEIHDSLLCHKGVRIFGAGYDLTSQRSNSFNYEKYLFLEELSDPTFDSNLQSILETLSIDLIFMAHDEWIYKFRDIEYIYGVKILKHPAETVRITSFKSETYQALQHLDITPQVFKNFDDISYFPCIIKPDRGQGSRGFRILNNSFELQELINSGAELDKLVISEFLPGAEYTVDCFTDQTGSLLVASTRLRAEIKDGMSISTRLSVEPEFSLMATQLNNELQFEGPWFFQVKFDRNERAKLLEIGCRVAGASGIQRATGVNFSSLWTHMTLGAGVIISKNSLMPVRSVSPEKLLVLGMTFDQIYVDFDDCLVINNEININLLDFLRYAKHLDHQIILISRHKGNLSNKLEEMKIKDLFSKIIHIRDNSKKSSFMSNNQKILFIDDSFSERPDSINWPKVQSVDPSIFIDKVVFSS
jgi:hypothetical protein